MATCDNIESLYNSKITIQWHDTETPYETAKQIASQNSKETWYNTWMSEEKGRKH